LGVCKSFRIGSMYSSLFWKKIRGIVCVVSVPIVKLIQLLCVCKRIQSTKIPFYMLGYKNSYKYLGIEWIIKNKKRGNISTTYLRILGNSWKRVIVVSDFKNELYQNSNIQLHNRGV